MSPYQTNIPLTPLRPLGMMMVALLLVSALSACSSKTPTLGETMRNQGIELAAIGDQWTEGDMLVSEGEQQLDDGKAMIEDGRELMNDGDGLVDQGEANIRKGQNLKRTAEVAFRDKTGRDLPTK